MNTWSIRILILLFAFGIAACGGGGGNDSPPPNLPPTIANQGFNATEDITLAQRIAAADPGDVISFQLVTPAGHGQVTVANDGAFTYVPSQDYNGTDSFTVRVTDSIGQSAVGTITLAIAPVNDAPRAANDYVEVTSGPVAVLANDFDVDGDTLTVELVGTPFVGTAVVNPNRSVALTLPAGFKGVTKFSYRVRDPSGETANATAVVFVGIKAFQLVYSGVDSGNNARIFLDDLIIKTPIHPVITDGYLAMWRVSSNNRSVAYYIWNSATGEQKIYFVDLARLGEVRVASASISVTHYVDDMVFSPDGRYLAYQLKDNNGVRQGAFLFDAQGIGPARQLSADPSTQGGVSTVQFNATSSNLYFLSPGIIDGSIALYRMALPAGTPTRVTRENSGGFGPILYYVSPDETRAVYWGSSTLSAANPGVFGVPLNGSGAEVLLSGASIPRVEPPLVTPDGARMVLVRSVNPPQTFVLAQTSAASTLVPLGTNQVQLGAVGITPIGWIRADSSAWLVRSAAELSPGVSVTNLYEIAFANPSVATKVNATFTSQLFAGNPFYSSDGERITYTVQAPAGFSQLQVTKRGAFGVSTPLTPADQFLSSSSMDPSGRVALVSLNTTSSSTASLVNVDVPMVFMPIASSIQANEVKMIPR